MEELNLQRSFKFSKKFGLPLDPQELVGKPNLDPNHYLDILVSEFKISISDIEEYYGILLGKAGLDNKVSLFTDYFRIKQINEDCSNLPKDLIDKLVDLYPVYRAYKIIMENNLTSCA